MQVAKSNFIGHFSNAFQKNEYRLSLSDDLNVISSFRFQDKVHSMFFQKYFCHQTNDYNIDTKKLFGLLILKREEVLLFVVHDDTHEAFEAPSKSLLCYCLLIMS